MKQISNYSVFQRTDQDICKNGKIPQQEDGTVMQVRLKDLAEKLGLASSTVSRALRNHPDISENTRQRVRQLAEELHYEPDAVALSLRIKKSHLVAGIVPDLAHPFFSAVVSVLEEVFFRNGYQLAVYQSREDYRREAEICRRIERGGIEGVLVSLSRSTRDTQHFRKLSEEGMPLVFFDRIAGDLDTDRVVTDDFHGAYEAVSHLIRSGCRRIMHFAGDQYLQFAQKRRAGYIQALQDHRLKVDEKWIIPCENRKEAVEQTYRVKKLFGPDAFFAVNAGVGAGILQALNRLGCRVPDEVSVCAFSGGDRSVYTVPELTAVEQKPEEIGKIAAEMLLKRMSEKESSLTVTKLVKTRLVIRESTRSAGQTE